jgi:arsenite-transporting ATPase
VRLLLYAGTGGAGTTTVAAATALRAARRGVKTLLLTPEPAAAPGRPLGAAGGEAPVEVEPGLFARHVDARSRAGRAWSAVEAPAATLLAALGVDPAEATEFTPLPGLDDVLTLLEIRDAATAGWDLVVVDTPALARTVRLLALPAAAVRTVDRVLPIERRMLWAMGHGGTATLPAPPRGLIETAERVQAELGGVRDVLAAAGTAVRLVLAPHPAALAEARHARTVLALHAVDVEGVVVNRLVPADGEDPWRRTRAAAEARVPADAEAAFVPLPVARLAERAVPPAGVGALIELAEELADQLPPELPERPAGPARGPAVERAGDGFVLVLPLPGARREDVELARRGDELVVDVAGERRVLELASVLRRCVVSGAAIRDGALQVTFRPDPDLWRAQ